MQHRDSFVFFIFLDPPNRQINKTPSKQLKQTIYLIHYDDVLFTQRLSISAEIHVLNVHGIVSPKSTFIDEITISGRKINPTHTIKQVIFFITFSLKVAYTTLRPRHDINIISPQGVADMVRPTTVRPTILALPWSDYNTLGNKTIF